MPKKIQFFDKNQTSIIEVESYYEGYYINKGFKKIFKKKLNIKTFL